MMNGSERSAKEGSLPKDSPITPREREMDNKGSDPDHLFLTDDGEPNQKQPLEGEELDAAYFVEREKERAEQRKRTDVQTMETLRLMREKLESKKREGAAQAAPAETVEREITGLPGQVTDCQETPGQDTPVQNTQDQDTRIPGTQDKKTQDQGTQAQSTRALDTQNYGLQYQAFQMPDTQAMETHNHDVQSLVFQNQDPHNQDPQNQVFPNQDFLDLEHQDLDFRNLDFWDLDSPSQGVQDENFMNEGPQPLQDQYNDAPRYRSSQDEPRLDGPRQNELSQLSEFYDEETAETTFDKASRDFKKMKDVYKAKVQNGTRTIDDDIEFSNVRRKFGILERQQERQGSDTDEDSVHDGVATVEPDAETVSALNVHLAKTKKQEKAQKKAQEESFQESSKDMINPAPAKRGRKRKSAVEKFSKKQNKRQKTMQQNIERLDDGDFSDLFAGNTLAAARQNQDRGHQPAFSSRQKVNMFKDMLASVPRKDQQAIRNEANEIRETSKLFRHMGDCMPVAGLRQDCKEARWTLKGLTSTLHTFQMLGTSWMYQQEDREEVPFGGLLADDMGIGKTVMTLANIANARNTDMKGLPTLIVAPKPLIGQWESEIIKHIDPKQKPTVLQFTKSCEKLIGDDPQKWFKQFKFVLITYHELMRQWPKYSPPPELDTYEQKMHWWKEYSEESKGVLLQVDWQRVVFDEVHNCRNFESRTSQAAVNVKAKYRWLLTGTPLINSSSDFFAYFRILHIPTGSFAAFKFNFCDDDTARSRLRVKLKSIMLRRTHASELFKQPILKLPDNESETKTLEFSKFERAVYDFVYTRFVEQIKENIGNKSKTKEYRYAHIFVLILRLRQLTSHVFLVQQAITDLLQKEDFEKLMKLIDEELEREHSSSSKAALRAMYDGMKAKAATLPSAKDVSTEALDGQNLEPQGVSTEPVNSQNPSDTAVEAVGGAFGNHFATMKDKLVDVVRRKTGQGQSDFGDVCARSRCNLCLLLAFEPVITNCGHLYCQDCLLNLEDPQRSALRRKKFDSGACRQCGEIIRGHEHCKNLDEFEDADRSNDLEAEKDNQSWLASQGHMFPSTKLLAVKARITTWLEQAPDEKIIVFSQFVSILRYAARMVQNEGVGILEFNGSMTQKARDKSIQLFAADPNRKVLFASLKTGGTGLNLAMANKVINIEPWWNEATESQAYCRVFRLGQEKETKVSRLMIKDTIDDRLMMVKDRKNVDISKVMDSKSPIFREMAYNLFGFNGDGSEFIWPDDKSYKPPEGMSVHHSDQQAGVGGKAQEATASTKGRNEGQGANEDSDTEMEDVSEADIDG